MKVAVVGAGRMGGMHAALLGTMPAVAELLVVDAERARAAQVAEATGGRVVGWDEALDRAGAVVLATPSELHCEQVIAALDAGRSVLCEKPLADSLADSLAVARRAARDGAHLEIGFQRRHDAGFVAARRAVTGGETGRLHLVRLTALDPRVPRREPDELPQADAAPLFLYSSIHDFDFVRWITGSEVVEVHVDGSRRDDPRPSDPRGIESAVVSMRLADGALAVLEASWLHPSGYDVRVELLAERAHLTMGLSARTPARHLDWPADAAAQPASGWSWYLERFEPAYRAELQAFLAAVRRERPPASSARDGVEAMRIAVAATRSYVERRTVALDEIDRLDDDAIRG